MSNIEGLNLFGKLTIKPAQIEETNGNKIKVVISENGELSFIENSDEYDSVELSGKEKDEAENINEKQVKKWQQEAKINAEMDLIKAQVIKDFTGEDPKDIIAVLDILGDFKADFIENFPEDGDISTMSEEFKIALVEEYEEIKLDAKQNTKSAIKDRVIETLLEEMAKDTEQGGRMLLGVVGPDSVGLSDDIKKQITKELEKESEKYMKNYTGNNLEEDLAAHLHKFLAETDKEKLSGAVQKWEDDKSKISKEEKQDKNALRQMKENVKSFLVTALMMGVEIELDGTVIRTEVAIPPALSKYDDADSLKVALDSAISQLSAASKKDKLLGKTKKETMPQNNLFSFKPQENKVNFFKL